MDLKQFENKLNNKFEDYEPLVDGMKIWDNIEDQLPQPKEKKRFLWMWFLVPVLVFVLGYQLIDSTGTENSVDVNQTQVSSLDQDTDAEKLTPAPAEMTESEVEEDLAIVSRQSQASNTQASMVQVSKTKEAKAQLNRTSDNAFATAQKTVNLKKGSTVKAQPPSNNINQSLIKNNLGGNLELVAGSAVAGKASIAEDKIIDAKGTEKIEIVEKIVPAKATVDVEKVSESTVKEVDETVAEPSGPVVELPVMEEQKTEEVEKAPIAEKKAETRQFKASSSLTTTATVYGAMRSFVDVNPTQQGLIDKKSEVEKSLETIQFGLDYERNLSKRWSVTTGLRVWQYTRSSEHSVANVTEDLLPTLTEVNHLPDGSIENVIENVTTQVIESYDAVRYQRYQSLSALALLNYKIFEGKKASIDLGAGAEFSLLGAQTGYELNTETTEYLMTDDLDNRYKKRSGDYLVLRLRSMIDLNDQWRWSLGLESKYGLNGIQQDGLGYNQKFNFLGIQTGFNYTF